MDPILKPDSEQPRGDASQVNDDEPVENTFQTPDPDISAIDDSPEESPTVSNEVATIFDTPEEVTVGAPEPAVSPELPEPEAIEPDSASQEQAVPEHATETSTAPSPEAVSSPAPSVEPVVPAVSQVAPVVMTPGETGAPTVSMTPAVVAGGTKGVRKKLLATIVAVVVIILLAGGYAFAVYLPNTPSRVYSSSLNNTGKALDKLVSYTEEQDAKNYKSESFDGTVKVKSGSVSLDSSLNGTFDQDTNGKLQLKADIEGEHISANVVSVKAAGNTSPDVYLQVSGIKNYLDGAGMGALDSLDGQWISIDHTLIDTYAASIKNSVGAGSEASAVPTVAQINDAISKVQTVNKQYLFTTDSTKAVLTNEKFIAKEVANGRNVNHYVVGYNKAHLQAYVSALQTALDSSQLNDWSKRANDGKNLSKAMDFDSLSASVKNAKSDYTFDFWADTKTKLISRLQFTDPSDKSSVFALNQSYTGGDKYPLGISFSGKDDTTGADESGTLNLTVDTSTNKYTGNLAGDIKGDDPVTFSADFTITPSNGSVKVSAPSGAKSINDVMSELGLGGLSGTAQPDAFGATSPNNDSAFTLTQ